MDIFDRLKKFFDKEDMSNYIEPPGIGIAWLWKLPDTHPFFEAAVNHDGEYDLMREGKSPYDSSAIPDFHFYQDCVIAAAEQDSVAKIEYYLAQAHIFYALISTWGLKRWKNEKQL